MFESFLRKSYPPLAATGRRASVWGWRNVSCLSCVEERGIAARVRQTAGKQAIRQLQASGIVPRGGGESTRSTQQPHAWRITRPFRGWVSVCASAVSSDLSAWTDCKLRYFLNRVGLWLERGNVTACTLLTVLPSLQWSILHFTGNYYSTWLHCPNIAFLELTAKVNGVV